MDPKQLTATQNVVWKQLGEATKDCKLHISDPTYLLYWLLVCDFNSAKAEKLLRKSLEWRRQYRIDTILEDYKPLERIEELRRSEQASRPWVDFEGILNVVKIKDYLMFLVWLMEGSMTEIFRNPEKFRHSHEFLIQTTFIVDMEGFSMLHFTSKRVREAIFRMADLFESNYPESYRRIIIINAPNAFKLAFNLVKPFLNQRTQKKISVFYQDEKLWKAALLEKVDLVQLPACYGGTLTDSDGNPNCATMASKYGWQNSSKLLPSGRPDITNKKILVVPNGSKELLDFQIYNAGIILKWNFHSEDGDINFAVYRQKGKELTSIVPHDRIDCQISAEVGEIYCDELGLYIVEFDNTFSYSISVQIGFGTQLPSITSFVQNENNLAGV